MQGARILRNEAYFSYVGMTKDEAQRRRWTFYEAVKGAWPNFDLCATVLVIFISVLRKLSVNLLNLSTITPQ